MKKKKKRNLRLNLFFISLIIGVAFLITLTVYAVLTDYRSLNLIENFIYSQYVVSLFMFVFLTFLGRKLLGVRYEVITRSFTTIVVIMSYLTIYSSIKYGYFRLYNRNDYANIMSLEMLRILPYTILIIVAFSLLRFFDSLIRYFIKLKQDKDKEKYDLIKGFKKTDIENEEVDELVKKVEFDLKKRKVKASKEGIEINRLPTEEEKKIFKEVEEKIEEANKPKEPPYIKPKPRKRKELDVKFKKIIRELEKEENKVS